VEYHERAAKMREEHGDELVATNRQISESVTVGKSLARTLNLCMSQLPNRVLYLARSKQAQTLALHAEEINKIQKTSATIRHGLSSRVSDIVTHSNEHKGSIHQWVRIFAI
jgi:hypothetical protein